MAVWHSVFLQEFADGRIENFNAVPGRLVNSPEPPETIKIGVDPGSAVQIVGDRWYRFNPGFSLERVIGLDLTLEVNMRFHMVSGQFVGTNRPIVLLSVGDQIRLTTRFHALQVIGLNQVLALGSFRLRVAGSELVSDFDRLLATIGLIPIHIATGPIRLHIQWHTGGQARFSDEGHLVAFANDVAVQTKLQVDHILIGPTGLPEAFSPHFDVSFLHVSLLRDHDASDYLGEYLPLDLPDDPLLAQCTQQILSQQFAILDRYRAFMTVFSQKTTNKWQAGDPGMAFSRAAVDAHRLAKEALLAVTRFLKTWEQADADGALDRFGKFFDILRLHLPSEFKALLAELEQVPAISPECRALAEEAIARNQPQIRPVLRLLQAIFDLAKAGTNGG